jgi:8-oxo-dGTP diphosphatase
MQTEPRHKVVVAGIIRDERGRYLLCQRPLGGWGAGKWEFPGGKLEVGEHPAAALQRECREELNVEVEVGPVVELVSHTYPGMDPVLLIFLEARIVLGEPSAVGVGALAWEPVERLGLYDWLEADLPVIREIERRAGATGG